jgi:hypothetical protein
MTASNKPRRVIAAMLALIIAGVAGCSPGKKLLKSQQELQQLHQQQLAHDAAVAAKAVEEFTKNNPCPPFPEIDLDSLCSMFYCTHAVNSSNTTAADYSEITTPQQSKAAAKKAVPKRILVPWEDTRRINLLADSITAKDKRIAVYTALLQAQQTAGIEAGDTTLSKIKLLMWIFLAIAIAELLAIILIARR